MKDLYINGMTTIEDVIDMIKDNVDRGDLADANDYLDQFKEYLLQPKIWVEPSKSEREEGKKRRRDDDYKRIREEQKKRII